jgi:RNA polymerase sigma-70 factor, ECF subfamily
LWREEPVAEEAPDELIEQAKQDPAAFGLLYDLYVRRIYGFAVAHSRSREEAEDLTSQTFERALRAVAGYRQRGVPFSQWLYRIAANLAIDRARRRGGVVLVGEASMPVAGRRDHSPGPPELVERWERASRLLERMEDLPSEQQDAIRLRFWKERTFTEIGDAMGRSEQAAKQLVYRAIRKLRLEIEQEARAHA